MARKSRQQKWIYTLCSYLGGHEATCPNCGEHNFKDACVELNPEEHSGFGAFWCEDCRNALMLCRADLSNEHMRKKIVHDLPKDLIYI